MVPTTSPTPQVIRCGMSWGCPPRHQMGSQVPVGHRGGIPHHLMGSQVPVGCCGGVPPSSDAVSGPRGMSWGYPHIIRWGLRPLWDILGVSPII